jgi:hypothetical protein
VAGTFAGKRGDNLTTGVYSGSIWHSLSAVKHDLLFRSRPADARYIQVKRGQAALISEAAIAASEINAAKPVPSTPCFWELI